VQECTYFSKKKTSVSIDTIIKNEFSLCEVSVTYSDSLHCGNALDQLYQKLRYLRKGSFNRNEAHPSIFTYYKIMLNYLLQKIKQN